MSEGKTLLYLQHVSFESPGIILKWAQENKFNIRQVKLYEDHTLPQLDEFDWLVIMGGPMGVFDEHLHSWLKQEKKFIKEAVQAQKVVLGICLGAQLLADVLGGKVTKNTVKEIGWFNIFLTEDGAKEKVMQGIDMECTVLHWHGDTFSLLPSGARHLAYSEGCKNQAFVYNERVVGLQFHLEGTEDTINAILDNCSEELKEQGEYIQSSAEIKSKLSLIKQTNRYMYQILNNLYNL